jgi:hypothetical protein
VVWVNITTIIETAYRRIVPLYTFDERGRPYLFASAVPFQSGPHRFLITAAHCAFEKGEPLPLFVYGESKLHALIELRGAWEHQQGQPDLDIAVIGLSEKCADDLQARHWFSSPEDVSVVKPKTPGLHYLLAGYPASRNKRRPVQFGLPSRAVALITGDICSVKTVQGVNKTEEDHFAIEFPHKTVDTPGGGVFQVPPPYGMSGGGVWRVEIDTIRNLVGTPSLVGIGIEYHKAQKTFVATRVQAAAPLAMDLVDPSTPITVLAV